MYTYYEIAKGNNSEELKINVTKNLNNGWRLTGGVIYTGQAFMQAMYCIGDVVHQFVNE